MTPPTITVILVPGFWLGAWAWSAVAEQLRSAGLKVIAVTLPGLESAETDRAGIGLADHVDAVIDTLPTVGPTVLVAHSGAGAVATGVLDRVPGRVDRVVYVDSGPVGDGQVSRPDLDAADLPLPTFEALEAEGNSLAGLDEQQLQRFRDKAVPQPGGVVSTAIVLGNPRRNDVPATVICCSFPSAMVAEAGDVAMFQPLRQLTDVTYLDLPTGHWPMWSKPEELATLIEQSARAS